MYRNNPVKSNSSNSPRASQSYYSRILLPKVSGDGPIYHSQKRHSLLNGSSSTSSDCSKQSLVSAYFGRSRTLHRDSPSYMPTIFNFQPVNGYHSPVLKRRVCGTERTKTNLVGTTEPPNSDVTIQRGLRVFESKKRARELIDTTVTTEESSHDESDFGNSKRRKTSRTFDISTLGCTQEVDGFSFTSLRQLSSGNAVRLTVCPSESRIPPKVNERNSKSVQTQVLNECENDRTVSTISSTGSVEPTRNNILGSAAALRRKVPYMSPSELEAHLLSTKALTYTSLYTLENYTSEAGDCHFVDLDTSPVQYPGEKVAARRIATESIQTTEDSTQSTLNDTKSPRVTYMTCYDQKSATDSSELPVVQPTSLNRFIANLEGHSNLFFDKMIQSHVKTNFYRPSDGFDVESRVKRIRELISAKSINYNSSSLCGHNTHTTISSLTGTSHDSSTTQILAISNAPLIVSTISSSLPSVSSTSSINFMSVIVCSTSASSVHNITSVSNPLSSSTTSKHFSFPTISEVVSTQTIVPTSVAVASITSVPGTISFGFNSASNVSAPSTSVTSSSTVLSTAVTSVAFSFFTPASTAHVSLLKDPTITSTIAVASSASVSYSAFPSVTKLGSISASQNNFSVVPSSVVTFPTSAITTSSIMISETTTTAATQKTTPVFSFTFPSSSSNLSSPQTTGLNLPSAANLTSSVFESLKPVSTFSGFSSPKPSVISSVSTTASDSTPVVKNMVQSIGSQPFTFGSSTSQPISAASLFKFGAPTVTTSALNPVSSVSFGLTSAPQFLGSFSNSAPLSSSFVLGANLSKSLPTTVSTAFVQTTATSSLNTVVNNAGLFTFTSSVTSNSSVSLFGSNSINTNSTTVSLSTNTSFSSFNSTAMNPLFTSVPKTSANSFTLGIKPANVIPANSTSLFGASNSIFETPNTSSVKFNFNQLTPSSASSVATTGGLSFGATIVTTASTSITPASAPFQFGSFSFTSKPSVTSVSQPFSFGSSVPQFSFGQQFTPVHSQPNTVPTLPFSSLISGSTTNTNAYQFSSTPVFSNANPISSFGGFNFSLPPTSTPSIINPQTNTGFVFGQTALGAGVVNSNPFTFGTSSTSPSSNAPNAPRRRPLSSRRSRRP
ncbi:unnamed protein product [Schistosoma turkestanicum]|nr:unnamed protein product [Schistosoma turkestanicum]